MKRVKAACICQTLHFLCKEDVPQERAAALVQDEFAQYKKKLDNTRTQYKIVEESTQGDGSIVVKVIKQYNSASVGDYLR